jgi:hypothetical protein
MNVPTTITRATYPTFRHLRGACTAPGCKEPPIDRWEEDTAYFEGWFRSHVLETGHTVEVREIPS